MWIVSCYVNAATTRSSRPRTKTRRRRTWSASIGPGDVSSDSARSQGPIGNLGGRFRGPINPTRQPRGGQRDRRSPHSKIGAKSARRIKPKGELGLFDIGEHHQPPSTRLHRVGLKKLEVGFGRFRYSIESGFGRDRQITTGCWPVQLRSGERPHG